jgi:ferredoxin
MNDQSSTEGGPKECIEEAMEACPAECIHWEE